MTEQDNLFEGINLYEYTPTEINNAIDLYNLILESANESLDADLMLDDTLHEGLFRAVVGGTAGLLAGPAIMKAVCKVLGISSGRLYDLLTSRLVTTAIGAALGK